MPDIGATLRDARMARRLDITEVEAATKIRAKYLRALENEEWDLLPGPTFVRTFLRTYGDYLELDSRMLVEAYKQHFQRPSQQDLLPFGGGSGRGRGGGRRPPRGGGRGIPPVVLVGAVVVILLAALFALGTLGGDDAPTAAPTPTPTASATRTSADRAADARQQERAGRARARERQPTRVRFQAVATGDVNVCLVSGTTGDVLIDAETLSDGDRTRVVRARRLLVVFGNNAVRMRLDGKTVTVPASASPIGYDLRPGRAPRRLGADDQPSCS